MGKDLDFEMMCEDSLVWLPEHGIGYYPVKEAPYDEAYFDKYAGYANTPMGKELTKQRIEFVNKYLSKDNNLVDIGVGCGDFVSTRNKEYYSYAITLGYDINPKGIQWLQEKDYYFDPTKEKADAVAFWDSLEHIHNPDIILNNITNWVFVSMPIYSDADHILRSKHFKKDEHCWYFTKDGLVNWMKLKGFECKEISHFESLLGREDILSFAFKRFK